VEFGFGHKDQVEVKLRGGFVTVLYQTIKICQESWGLVREFRGFRGVRVGLGLTPNARSWGV